MFLDIGVLGDLEGTQFEDVGTSLELPWGHVIFLLV